jgi:putative DNA methylase
VPKRKLIEVALPLEEINKQSAREKSIRHGHPSTLHLWWARRPLATARAVLFAQLVNDPSEYADEYRDEAVRHGEADVQDYVDRRIAAERERLFDLIRRMVDWDNLGDEALFDQVRAEIMRSTDGRPPAILDPFAGGGTIPLEAQRLGLEAHASDLNPVAVLINKALIEIPPKFAGRPPVFPDAAGQRNSWPKATGLAEDVRRYGQWMRDEAERRIGHLYPKATLADGSKATVIAWIWARTVTCPNPACGIEMPLVRSWWLGKKKGKEAYVVPRVVDGNVEFDIGHDPKLGPSKLDDGTMSGRTGATCVSCGTAAPVEYIKTEGAAGRLGAQLLAIVAEGSRQRIYLPPADEHVAAAEVSRPDDVPNQKLGFDPRNIWTPAYGLDTFASLFTNRQLTALTTFSDLVGEARERVLTDAVAAGLPEGSRLEAGGTDAAAYADAVATYLGFAVDRVTGLNCSLTRWNSAPSKESVTDVFGRQAIPMVWDFAEANVFQWGPGNVQWSADWVARALDGLPSAVWTGEAEQLDAASRPYENLLISTDPPYYDNIGYSDLSDFFYVWMRRSVRDIHPRLLGTMLVPKAEELVANPYRHGGKDEAQEFFEHGFERVFEHARRPALAEFPIAVFYAFKQSETETQGTASTGWETILASMIRAGWVITATWPVRSERSGRMISVGTNALASSIVLALRPRAETAAIIDRRGLVSELRTTLPNAVRDLQQGGIAPVDLAQAAIGPGMAIFSKYAKVIEPNGEPMSVRDALRQINAILDEVLSEQEGDFDGDTRWCVAWFEQHGFGASVYGEAETLANAKNASISGLAHAGVLSSGAGKVKLFAPDELPDGYDPMTDERISLWDVVLHLAKALSATGLDAAGRILARAELRGVDMTAAHELAYRLFAVSEKLGLTQAAILFNTLGSSWSEVRTAADAAVSQAPASVSSELDFDSLLEE